MAETNDNGRPRRSSCVAVAGGGSGGDGPPKRTSRMVNKLSDTNNKSKVTWTPTNEKRQSKGVVLFGQQQSPSSPLSEQETTTSVARQLPITNDRYLGKQVAKNNAGVYLFGKVIAVHPDKNDKRRKVYEVRFDNIKDTEEVYTNMVRDWRANYNNPDISQYDKSNFPRVGDEDQQEQPPKDNRGSDQTKTTTKKQNHAKRSI